MDDDSNDLPHLAKTDPEPLNPEALPVCPYCQQDPAVMSLRGPMPLGQFFVVVVFCGNQECRKVWNTDIVGRVQPLVIQKSPLSLS